MYDKDTKGKKANPFILPENYFENFHEKLMQQLPQEGATQVHLPQRTAKNRWQKWSYAAIITLALAIATTATLYNNPEIGKEISEAERNEIIETIFDNYPIDDYNVYCYLTSADYNF